MYLDEYNQDDFDRGKSGLYIFLWWFIQGTVFKYSLHNMYGWRRFLLRIFGAKIGKNVKVRSSAKFTYPWKISIGDYSWVGDEATLYSLDKIIIGNNCVVSQKAYLCTGSHDYSSKTFDLITSPIIVEDFSWISTDVFIHPGVTVKRNSIVGARSNLTKNTKENSVNIGNPAKFIKYRYSEV
ncbi:MULTISPECIES: putative colanic acid biosynthesis acetyltransferase [unclassified Exiguobacterium]|uniref:putative colanic acid biosynthesis acetyltransferase n=1 Tax=unclassified Exiguobacterium TaxID=2644629 RepID=UPI0025C40B4C|nr:MULTISPECIES: putative colanic acid biosynthesis acetyltransferase [unclassified Exiguobacterium]